MFVLVVFLGLNVSAIGLVEIPRGSFLLVAELFGLIVVINVGFAATFVVLERAELTALDRHSHDLVQPRQEESPG